jgi:hypothetical protein
VPQVPSYRVTLKVVPVFYKGHEDVESGQLHAPAVLRSGTFRLRDWVGPRGRSRRCRLEKNMCPYLKSIPDLCDLVVRLSGC